MRSMGWWRRRMTVTVFGSSTGGAPSKDAQPSVSLPERERSIIVILVRSRRRGLGRLAE